MEFDGARAPQVVSRELVAISFDQRGSVFPILRFRPIANRQSAIANPNMFLLDNPVLQRELLVNLRMKRAFLLLPVGYPKDPTYVPDLKRKELEEVAVFYD